MYTNPAAPLGDRVLAIDGLIDGLVTIAKESGFRTVVATCRRKSMEQRVARLGFGPLGTYRLVIKELR